MEICEKFEQLIAENKIKFRNADLSELEEFGQSLVVSFLQHANIKWKLGDIVVGQGYCLQLEDDTIGYLDIDPEQQLFWWCNKDHSDGFHPDVASAHWSMLAMPGMRVRCVVDDTTGIRTMEYDLPNGHRVYNKDYVREDGTRVLEYGPIGIDKCHLQRTESLQEGTLVIIYEPKGSNPC